MIVSYEFIELNYCSDKSTRYLSKVTVYIIIWNIYGENKIKWLR